MTREEVDARMDKLQFSGDQYREDAIRRAAANAASRDYRYGVDTLGNGQCMVPWKARRPIPTATEDSPRSGSYYTLYFWHPGGTSFASQLVIEEQLRAQLDELGL